MDSPSSPETPIPIVDLYSLLKVDRNATEEEIHRAFKSLSTTFHPDKLPPSTTSKDRERIQQIFLEFKRASTYMLGKCTLVVPHAAQMYSDVVSRFIISNSQQHFCLPLFLIAMLLFSEYSPTSSILPFFPINIIVIYFRRHIFSNR